MGHQLPTVITFSSFILLFLGVGIYSGTHQEETSTDYLLASRSVNPWFTALSAIATGNSGFMFIGLIGFTYQIGLSAIWLTFGWVFGDLLAWIFVHRRLRTISETADSETIPAFLGHATNVSAKDPASDGGDRNQWITIAAALITLAFLGTYAAAQLQAGSKALNVIFDWDYSIGVLLGGAIVTIYCLFGGIRASIWIGSTQALIMIVSMILLLVVSVMANGGVMQLWDKLQAIDPQLISLIPPDLQFGLLPFVLGWLVAGFGVVGQPHIMIRAMAIDSAENIQTARNVYIGIQTLFSLAAIAVGLASRVLLPELMTGGDVELALPELAATILPGILVGFVLAGLFSATLSTADAQLLACAAALTHDLVPASLQSPRTTRIGLVFTMGIILAIALIGSDNVFTLVTFSWAALAAGLGPVLIVRVLKCPLNPIVGLVMMTVGIGTAILWRFGIGWSSAIYEVLPGMVASALVYLISFPFMDGMAMFSNSASSQKLNPNS